MGVSFDSAQQQVALEPLEAKKGKTHKIGPE